MGEGGTALDRTLACLRKAFARNPMSVCQYSRL